MNIRQFVLIGTIVGTTSLVAAPAFGDGANAEADTTVVDDVVGLIEETSGTCHGFPVTRGGTSGNDSLDGTDQDDVMAGYRGNDSINAHNNGILIDDVCGGPGDDSIFGGGGDDEITGGSGDDGVFGQLGSDVLDGRAGNDTVTGGAGNDEITDTSGLDLIKDGFGLDEINTMDGEADIIQLCDDGVLLDDQPARDLLLDTVQGPSSAYC